VTVMMFVKVEVYSVPVVVETVSVVGRVTV
jgi:hypothetical protein